MLICFFAVVNSLAYHLIQQSVLVFLVTNIDGRHWSKVCAYCSQLLYTDDACLWVWQLKCDHLIVEISSWNGHFKWEMSCFSVTQTIMVHHFAIYEQLIKFDIFEFYIKADRPLMRDTLNAPDYWQTDNFNWLVMVIRNYHWLNSASRVLISTFSAPLIQTGDRKQFSLFDFDLWPMTLTYNTRLAKVKVDPRAKNQGQRSNGSNRRVPKDKRTNTHAHARMLPNILSPLLCGR